MIDLHAHVLPGLDDGPATVPEALALLRTMEEQGVKVVVAAVHALDGRYNVAREALLRGCEAMAAALAEEGLSIRVLPSMELFLSFDLLVAARRGQVVGLNHTPHLVVELPHRDFPAYTERALFELLMAGYRPILNHPERNRGVRREPDRLYRLLEGGVQAMVTAGSLLGLYDLEAQGLAEELIREGAAELVVSDAHDLVRRAPCLPEGLAAAAGLGKADQAAEASLLGIQVSGGPDPRGRPSGVGA